MTEQDLRLSYKRDTGNNVDIDRTEKVELEDNLTIYELRYPIDIEIEIYMDSIPYVVWLEEQLLINLNK